MFAAADAYDRHIGRYGGRLAQRLIEAAGLKAGDRALDVGLRHGQAHRGAGRAARHRRMWSRSIRRHRSWRRPVPSSRPCAWSWRPPKSCRSKTDTFDAALAQLVVNFMRDAHKGVGEMMRVTRPGGSVVAAVWDYRDGMTLLRRFWDAAAAIDPDSDPQDELNMRYATAEELARPVVRRWPERCSHLRRGHSRELRELRGPLARVRAGRWAGRRLRGIACGGSARATEGQDARVPRRWRRALRPDRSRLGRDRPRPLTPKQVTL